MRVWWVCGGLLEALVDGAECVADFVSDVGDHDDDDGGNKGDHDSVFDRGRTSLAGSDLVKPVAGVAPHPK